MCCALDMAGCIGSCCRWSSGTSTQISFSHAHLSIMQARSLPSGDPALFSAGSGTERGSPDRVRSRLIPSGTFWQGPRHTITEIPFYRRESSVLIHSHIYRARCPGPDRHLRRDLHAQGIKSCSCNHRHRLCGCCHAVCRLDFCDRELHAELTRA